VSLAHSTVAAFKRECVPGRKATIVADWCPDGRARTVAEVRTRDVVFFKEDGATRSYLTLKGAEVMTRDGQWIVSFPDEGCPSLRYTFA
jgi:hypothetical protein